MPRMADKRSDTRRGSPVVETRRVEFTLTEVRADDQAESSFNGEGTAVVSRIGVVDSYGDVMAKGSFAGNTEEVPMLPNHAWDSDEPPIGMMSVREEGDQVFGDFRMNMELPAAQRWLSHLQFAKKQEFSIGFRIDKAKWLSAEEMKERDDDADRIIEAISLKEVSMVVAGAMPETELLELRREQREKALSGRAAEEEAIVEKAEAAVKDEPTVPVEIPSPSGADTADEAEAGATALRIAQRSLLAGITR